MNNRNNRRGAQIAPQRTAQTGTQRKPGLAQPQTVALPSRQPLTPPAVGHAKPASQVLQSKMAVAARAQSLGNRKPPVAPPVYRPQAPPKVLQPKVAGPMSSRPAPPARMTNNVVQRVIVLQDQTDPITNISSVDEAMLTVNYEASPKAITHLRRQATSKDTHNYANWAAAVKAATEWVDPLNRLKRARVRSLNQKAKPRTDRFVFDMQQKHSYGFNNKVIDKGLLKGSYRSSRGQPYLSLNKDNYGGAVVETDYDSLIAVFKNDKHSEPEIAEAILALIDYGTFDKKEFSSLKTQRAISTIVQLTQIIEPHVNRVPGADKWARACFTAILNAETNFWLEFNRTSGNYLPARAKTTKKKKLSKYGGQESTRTFMGLPKKKTDRSRFSEVSSKGVITTLEEMSESSDDDNGLV